jgi:putative aminopeptidase FrvX
VAVARRAGIPVQVGTTNGGNDGSTFTRYGAIDIPIAWPLRYSHSPAELIDLGDVHALARLVAALARN